MTFSGGNRVAVDWDGTCVEAVWPAMGEWLPGARQALLTLTGAGYDVVVHTTRIAPTEIDEKTRRPKAEVEAEVAVIRKMLDAAALHEVDVWMNPWKPGALAYVDDKAVRFGGDWPGVLRSLGVFGESVCEEADRLVSGDRRDDYGHPLDDFSRIVGMVNVLFADKLAEPLVAEDWPLIMECVKMSRQRQSHKRDNLVDGAGYWKTLALVVAERARRS